VEIGGGNVTPHGAGGAAASALASALADCTAALTSIRITGARTYLHPQSAQGTFAALAHRYRLLGTVTQAVADGFAARSSPPCQVWFLTLARAVLIGRFAPGQAADIAGYLDRRLRAAAPPLRVSAVVVSLPGRNLATAAFSRALIDANEESRSKIAERTAFATVGQTPPWDMVEFEADFPLSDLTTPPQPQQAGLPTSHPLLTSPVEALALSQQRVGLLRLDAVGFLSHITDDGSRSFPDVADRSAEADDWFNRAALEIIAHVNAREAGIALLRSGTDDLIAMGHTAALRVAARQLRADYRHATGGELAAGLATLRPDMTEADLSRTALQRLGAEPD
jgi:hypothetical protein